MEPEEKSHFFSALKKQRSSPWFYWILLLFPATLFFVNNSDRKTCACGDSGDGIAKTYVAAMNRAQQAIYLDNKSFANSFDQLKLGISSETPHHNYLLRATDTAAFNYAIAKKESNNQKLSEYKSFIGVTFVSTDIKGETTFVSIICKSDIPGSITLGEPSIKNNIPICPVGTSSLSNHTYKVKREDNYQ